MNPNALIDKTPMENLRRYVAQEKSVGFVREGQRVLACPWLYAPGAFDEVAFDSENRIRRIDMVVIPPFTESEIRACYDGDLAKLRTRIYSLELDNYIEINGVAWPLTWKVTDYRGRIEQASDESRDELRALVQSGKHSEGGGRNPAAYVEKYVRLYTEKRSEERDWTIEIEFDRARLRINEPLTIEDFRLDFPTGSTIYFPEGLYSPDALRCGQVCVVSEVGGPDPPPPKDALSTALQGGNFDALVARRNESTDHPPQYFLRDNQFLTTVRWEGPIPEYMKPGKIMKISEPKGVLKRRNLLNDAGLVCGLVSAAAVALLAYVKFRRYRYEQRAQNARTRH